MVLEVLYWNYLESVYVELKTLSKMQASQRDQVLNKHETLPLRIVIVHEIYKFA